MDWRSPRTPTGRSPRRTAKALGLPGGRRDGRTRQKYARPSAGVDRTKRYSLEERGLVKSLSYAKYDEAIEIAVRLGIDAKKTDSSVRGSVVLRTASARRSRVLVFAKGDKEVEAREAAPDFHGGDELVGEGQAGGWISTR